MPNLGKILSTATKAASKAAKNAKKVAPKVLPKKSKAEIKAGVLPKNPTKKQLTKDFNKSQGLLTPRQTQIRTVAKAGAAATGAAAVLNLGNNLGGSSSSSKNSSSAQKDSVASQHRYEAAARHEAKRDPASLAAGKHGGSRSSGLSKSGRSFTAASGDSLWSIAEKTVPKGKSVTSWWLAIKKMNTVNGKVRRLYTGTGVSLPPGARRS